LNGATTLMTKTSIGLAACLVGSAFVGRIVGQGSGQPEPGSNDSASPSALTLQVARSGSEVVLSWRASGLNCVLETTERLLPAAVWMAATTPPAVNSGLNRVTQAIGAASP
jgi:hypothetical protein